jgi:hypothetical protein
MRLERSLRKLVFNMALMSMLAIASAAHAQEAVSVVPPNRIPLAFGMTAEQASFALGVPLNYVRGRPGDELFLALPNVKGMTLSYRSDGLYLQFRRGRLEGWKGDWGTIRP